MATMRAGIYKGKLQAEVVDMPKPGVGPKDVLVRTVRSSICGSDVSGVGVEAGVQFGHETAGYVAGLGKEVKGLKEGDRVWINPMNAMPKYQTCMLGGFSEYILVPDAKLNHNLFLLPGAISWDEASLIEPFGVGTRGKNRPGAKPGDHVVVYGAGSIGLFCISGLIAQGIIPVVIDIALSDYKRALLEKMGAVICPLNGDKFKFLKEHFGELPQRQSGRAIDVDIVVDCAGAPNIIDDFFKLCKPNSRLSIVGVNARPQEVNLARLMSTEVVMLGSSGYDLADIEEVIDNLAHKRTLVNEIITHHFPLEQLNEALNMAADREKSIKVVVDME
ncbi:zinc-dependent alcohol dehydrogenase [Desulfitobacterium chlororespirans]|uniref:Threonine dehydrogenase n=1 Tax=Desulfitobacterium chlororespirans DSM 11544 TaxID=1121395 RepID=A0A1M7SJA0_9FIRM|nr:zinc-binding dehydrogenase [Desulfitobacterium chlororespirans]SHN58557.1 Threonine dehydrogenase [Desulfitobacterium chlororespirans DSM 11544]